jgi:hypothetical protein
MPVKEIIIWTWPIGGNISTERVRLVKDKGKQSKRALNNEAKAKPSGNGKGVDWWAQALIDGKSADWRLSVWIHEKLASH